MRGVHTVFLSTTIFTLTGCATTSSLDWLRDDHAAVITEDLAVAVTERWPPTEAALYVGDMPLRDHFEPAIRGHGYAVSTERDDAILVTGVGERIPPNTWHIGLTVANSVHINRLYRIERDDVRALSSVSVGNLPSLDDDTELPISPQWRLRARAIPPRASIAADAPSQFDSIANEPNDIAALSGPVAPNVSGCPSRTGAVFQLNVGSLKQSVANILRHCGWTVIAWPTDSTNARQIVDWVVSQDTSVQVSSVAALLEGLRAAYGLVSTVDEAKREIAFSMEKTP